MGAIPLLLLSGPHVFVRPFHITHGMTLFALLYSIFFVTVFGLVMWYVGVQKIGASHTMVYMYITPLVAVLFAAVWANEYVSFQQIIGGIIIFVGLWFVKSEKVKVHSIAGGTYIKIGKQITYDLLSYFFIFGKKMRNKIAVISGIKFKNGIRKSVIRIIPGRRTPRTA